MMSQIPVVTQDNFQVEVLKQDLPSIVYFSTDGCGPCQAIEPVLQELQSKLQDRLLIKNVHVTFEEGIERTNKLAEEYEIMAYPTLLVMKDQEAVKYIIGKYTIDEILADLEGII